MGATAQIKESIWISCTALIKSILSLFCVQWLQLSRLYYLVYASSLQCLVYFWHYGCPKIQIEEHKQTDLKCQYQSNKNVSFYCFQWCNENLVQLIFIPFKAPTKVTFMTFAKKIISVNSRKRWPLKKKVQTYQWIVCNTCSECVNYWDVDNFYDK